MRALAALLVSIGLLLSAGAPVLSKSVSARVRVFMKVPRACTVHAPAVIVTKATAGSALTVKSFIAACTDDDVAAVLILQADPADKRTDVATINF